MGWHKTECKAELNSDLEYLQRVENEIQEAKRRDQMLLEQRRQEAEQTKLKIKDKKLSKWQNWNVKKLQIKKE